MQPFKLKAEYNPAGDQPQAIEELVKGLDRISLRCKIDMAI